MNTIKLDLPELEKVIERLDAILAELKTNGTPFDGPQPTSMTEPKTEPKTVPQEAQGPTAKEIQDRVVRMTAANADLKAKVRDIVREYAPKVSGIPADKRAEVWARLDALEG